MAGRIVDGGGPVDDRPGMTSIAVEFRQHVLERDVDAPPCRRRTLIVRIALKKASWTTSSASSAFAVIRTAKRYARLWYVVTRRSAASASRRRSASTSGPSRSSRSLGVRNARALMTVVLIDAACREVTACISGFRFPR